MRLLSFISLLCLATWRGAAADAAEGWDEFRLELVAERFSGVVLVARGEAIMFKEGFGFAHHARAELNRPDTAFRIGSLTKALTAAVVTELAEAGRLSLYAPLRDTWPEWPLAWAGVTADSLLRHTAGLPEYTNRTDFPASWMPAVSAPLLFKRLGTEPPVSDASAHPNYSNTHYVLLGALVERVTGQSYADVVAARLSKPAGMTRTRIWPAGRPRFHHAGGYAVTKGGLQPVEERPPELLGAAGALSATAEDLHRFLRWLAREGRPPFVARTEQPAYGWVEVRSDGRLAWACIGQVRGFAGAMLVRPDEELAVVVLSNVDQAPALQWALRALEAAAKPK